MPARPSAVPVVAATLVLIAGWAATPTHAAAASSPSRFAQRYKQLQQRLLLEGAEGRGGEGLFFPGERAGLPPDPAELAGARGVTPAARSWIERTTAALGSDVRVNDPSGDNPSATQSEVAVGAIGDHILIAFNDGEGYYHNPFVSAQGYAYSTDGGQSFVDGGSPPGITGWHWDSDPVVAVNEATGEYWYLGLNGTFGQNGIALVKATFSGGTLAWGTPNLVRAAQDFDAQLDKPWMAVDPASGKLYVTYTAFDYSFTRDTIDIQSSSDGGLTWSDPIQLSADADAGYVQGSRVAVGPAGEVYTSWYAIGQTATFLDRFQVRKSTNRAASFDPEVTGAELFSNFSSGAPGFNRPRSITFPSLAVDRSSGPHRGRVYLAWNECINFYLDPLGERPGPGTIEAEPNDTPAEATSFTVGDSLQGTLNSQQIDFFKFTAIRGQTVIAYAGRVDPNLDMSLRFLCTDGDAALALSAPGVGQNGLLIFTVPTTGTYYLRLKAVGGSGLYTVYTGFHAAVPGERARDHRDVFVDYSDDGVVWSIPARVNDDPAYLDNWLPEVAVSNLSRVYAIWYDWRGAPSSRCNAQSNIYLASSDDGGANWANLGTLSNAASDWTDWTGAKANIMPNQGDYIGLYADGQSLFAGWGDARDTDVNVYTARYQPGSQPPAVVPLRLQLVRSNPSKTGDIFVTLELPSAAPATLRLLDITGREVHSKEVGSYGPGSSTLNFGLGLDLRPGLYFVRLSQGRQDATARVIILK